MEGLVGLRRLCIILMLMVVSGCGSAPQRQVVVEPAATIETQVEEVVSPAIEPIIEPADEIAAPTPEEPAVITPEQENIPVPVEAPAHTTEPTIAKEPMGFNTAGEIPITERELKEKVMYANLMVNLSPGKRILASNNQEAKNLLSQTKIKAAEAKVKLAAGDLEKANELVNESYRLMSLAAALVPSAHQLAMEKARYPDLLEGLTHAKKLFHENYSRIVKKGSVATYDEQKVAELRKQADSLVIKGNYPAANKKLEEARVLVDQAIMAMLDNQTVVYEVDVSTPEKEFKYEYGRFESYAELVPVAIEMKKPGKGQMMLVERHVKKSRWMADQAKQTAEQGDYPKAIRMIMDAAVEVRKALKLMKVKTFE